MYTLQSHVTTMSIVSQNAMKECNKSRSTESPVVHQVIQQPKPVVVQDRIHEYPHHHRGVQRIHTTGTYSPGIAIGHLTDTNTNERHVLYGRPKDARANLWYYYTTKQSNGNLYDIVTIPIVSKSRVCMDDWGCHELYDNDVVHIEGDTTPLIAKIYNKHVFF